MPDDFAPPLRMPVSVEACEWIVDRALAGASEIDILTGLSERLEAAGFGLMRASVANDLLDPTYDARGVRWNRGTGGLEEVFPRTEGFVVNESWTRSPFFALAESGRPRLRRRLNATYRRGEFPLLDDFERMGGTDYVAFATPVGDTIRFGEGQGIVSSWLTDAQGGFSDAQIDAIAYLLPTLALAFMLHTTHRFARTAVATYLGSDAALRVLAGNIVRGRATPITAVVWYSDLVGFTRIADTVDAEVLLGMLNEYAEAQVEAIETRGGHVLKFIGDAILAIFPDDDTRRACERALDAADDQKRRMSRVNARRAAASLPVTGTHLALHLGQLLYGNVGSSRRLDFTVLGPAVNEAARIEALCGSLDQSVIVSAAFAEAAGGARERLVSLGRYAMKGVARPQELFTLDPG